MAETHEYAFDVKLAAAVRIRAPDEATARRQLLEVLDCADLSICHGGVDMNDTFEASIVGEPSLFEIDAELIDDDDKCRECGAVEGTPEYGTVGDGFDGLCPSCADEAADADWSEAGIDGLEALEIREHG